MRDKTPKPMSLLLVTWLDAGVITHGDWITKEEAIKDADDCESAACLNHTVGWLINETPTRLVIASQIAPSKGDEETRLDLVMFIPKVLVRKRKVLKA